MQRTYEIMFIVRPDIQDEDLDKLIAGFEAHVAKPPDVARLVQLLA